MSVADDHAALLAQYDHAAALLRDHARLGLMAAHEAVSGWSAAQHLAHVEAVNRSVLGALRRLERGGSEAEPEAARARGLAVLESGAFPRGRVQAPEFAIPPDDLSLADVQAAMDANRPRWEALDLDALATWTGTLPHPLLGPLTAAQWVRFVRMHTAHHHAIIGELV